MSFDNSELKVYDEISRNYKLSESNSTGKKTTKSRYNTLVEKAKPDSVLDLGCGSGVFSIIAKEFGAKRVVGVDISSAQIRLAKSIARQKNLDITYILGDISELSLPEKYEMVVSAFGFCYAQNFTTLHRQVRAAGQHLLPGGELFALVSHPVHPIRHRGEVYRTYGEDNQLKDGLRLVCQFLYDGKIVAIDHKYYWTSDAWHMVLTDNNFHKITWEELSPTSTNIILRATKI